MPNYDYFGSLLSGMQEVDRARDLKSRLASREIQDRAMEENILGARQNREQGVAAEKRRNVQEADRREAFDRDIGAKALSERIAKNAEIRAGTEFEGKQFEQYGGPFNTLKEEEAAERGPGYKPGTRLSQYRQSVRDKLAAKRSSSGGRDYEIAEINDAIKSLESVDRPSERQQVELKDLYSRRRKAMGMSSYSKPKSPAPEPKKPGIFSRAADFATRAATSVAEGAGKGIGSVAEAGSRAAAPIAGRAQSLSQANPNEDRAMREYLINRRKMSASEAKKIYDATLRGEGDDFSDRMSDIR